MRKGRGDEIQYTSKQCHARRTSSTGIRIPKSPDRSVTMIRTASTLLLLKMTLGIEKNSCRNPCSVVYEAYEPLSGNEADYEKDHEAGHYEQQLTEGLLLTLRSSQ
jgi:hypothetical protein